MGRPRSKGLDYFPHDTTALSDEKIQHLVSIFGATGYAIYFAILEKVFRAENGKMEIQKKYVTETLCRSLSISCDLLHEFIAVSVEIGALLVLEDGSITSNGALKRIKHINELRGRERERKFSAGKLPGKPTGKPAENPTETPESKVKESKVNKRKDLKEKEYARATENSDEKAKTPLRSKTSMPDDFGISPSVQKWAETRGIENLEAHFEYFKDACASKGYQYKDWDAAFRKAVISNWGNISAGNNGTGKRKENGYVGLDAKNYHEGLDGFAPVT